MIGRTISHYKILEKLGEGGMGVVYKAEDTKLKRMVALKFLPAEMTKDTEARQRFIHEAQAASALDHPNICTIHEIDEAEGRTFISMACIEGESLKKKIHAGPLKPEEAIGIAVQVAEGLQEAHEKGIVHRDIKPDNVMLTAMGPAKIMDFGLARSAGCTTLTKIGATLGTVAYMSPEQARGEHVDHRTDIWSLGVVLYEMVTGRLPFRGDFEQAVVYSILNESAPPVTGIRTGVPMELERAIHRCLEKDAGERYQTAADLAANLRHVQKMMAESTSGVRQEARSGRGRRRPWGVAVAVVGALAAMAFLGWAILKSRPREADALQAVVDLPPMAHLTEYRGNVAISPDGEVIAFAASDTAGVSWLWIRPLGADAAERIPDTHSAWLPFWSPDARYVAFFDSQEGKLRKVPIAGGSPTTICDAIDARGGTWNRDGVIVFAPAAGPLMRVAAGGGEPVAITALDSTRHESAHRFPCFLPDGKHFLFATLPMRLDGWDVYVGMLGSREVKRILTARSAPVYAEPGYLLFERDRQAMAQRFDIDRLELEGDALAIAVAPMPSGMEADPAASASRNGRLALLRSTPADTRLVMLDRSGVTCARYDLPPGPWSILAASRDGRNAAVANGSDIWIADLARSVPVRFASVAPATPSAVWSPDGGRVAFVSEYAGREEIHIASLDGRAEPVPTSEDPFKFVYDWSRDGRYIVFGGEQAVTVWDLWFLPLEGDRKPVPYLRSPSYQWDARLSPDGRWLAYASNETGGFEIYVQSFPDPGRKVRVSLDGGRYPLWAKGGRELLYSRGPTVATIISVPVEAGEEFRPGSPHPLFTLPQGAGLDVVADGEHFLVSMPTETRPRDIHVVLNWEALLKR